jgi:hypothetical protein
MTTTLKIKDIEILNEIRNHLDRNWSLSSDHLEHLTSFLAHLPPTKHLLSEKTSFDTELEIETMDISEVWPHLEKWIDLFNSLPKNGTRHYPSAGWINADEGDAVEKLIQANIIIEVIFIPSFAYSKKEYEIERSFALHLKTDGTAIFVLKTLDDTANFPELYQFNASWKEAYILLVKTLHRGWPQTKFPEELKKLIS